MLVYKILDIVFMVVFGISVIVYLCMFGFKETLIYVLVGVLSFLIGYTLLAIKNPHFGKDGGGGRFHYSGLDRYGPFMIMSTVLAAYCYTIHVF